MKTGISVWLFSKVVMLIFLFTVFAIVLSFLRAVNEKVSADSAGSLADQVKSSLSAVIGDQLLSAKRIVPLPATLPEKGDIAATPETQLKPYSLSIIKQGDVVSAAVSWDTKAPKAYVAASSFLTAGDVPEIIVDSVNYHFLSIQKSAGSIEICGCDKAACSGSSDFCCPSASNDKRCKTL